jgi:hypothetical protein
LNRIDINWSKEELDCYLKKRYGCEYWNFAHSLFWIYQLFKSKEDYLMISYCKKRVALLEMSKNKIIQIFDDLLTKIDFYKNFKFYAGMKRQDDNEFRWTTEERRKFIVERFKLERILYLITKIIKKYKKGNIFPRAIEGIKIRMKPLNLLILVWSNALTRNKRREWGNLELLLGFRIDIVNSKTVRTS